MAPSTTSHAHQSSSPSDSIQPQQAKRSLRSRGSNAGQMSSDDGGVDNKDGVKGSVIVVGDDARGGKFPFREVCVYVPFEFVEKSGSALPW